MKMVRVTASALKVRTLPVSDPATDTGKVLANGETVQAYGQSFDGAWTYVSRGDIAGWASSQYLGAPPAVAAPVALPARLKPPSGKAGIISVFGEPCKPACENGRAHLPAPLPLSWEPNTHVSSFGCHEKMAGIFTAVFAEIHADGLWHLLEDYGGCHECRPTSSGKKISTHAWGISIDLNTRSNADGAKPKMDSRIVAIFEAHGFTWGGRWAGKDRDGMHFQFATGY